MGGTGVGKHCLIGKHRSGYRSGRRQVQSRTNQDCEVIRHHQCSAGNYCEVSTAINTIAGADSGHIWDYSTVHIAHVFEGTFILALSCAETHSPLMTQMPISHFASK